MKDKVRKFLSLKTILKNRFKKPFFITVFENVCKQALSMLILSLKKWYIVSRYYLKQTNKNTSNGIQFFWEFKLPLINDDASVSKNMEHMLTPESLNLKM